DAEEPVDQRGEEAAGRPDGAAEHDIQSHADGLWGGGGIEIGTSAGNDGFEHFFVGMLGSNDDLAHGGTGAAHHFEELKAVGGRGQVDDQVLDGGVREEFLESADNGNQARLTVG